jgi:hypothetical protein
MLAVTAGFGEIANFLGALRASFQAAPTLGQTGAREPREQPTQDHNADQRHRRLEPTIWHQTNPDRTRQENPQRRAEPTEHIASQARSERQQQREPEEPRAEQGLYCLGNRVQARPKLIPGAR